MKKFLSLFIFFFVLAAGFGIVAGVNAALIVPQPAVPLDNDKISGTPILKWGLAGTTEQVNEINLYQYKLWNVATPSSEITVKTVSKAEAVIDFITDGIYKWQVRSCKDIASDSICSDWSSIYTFTKDEKYKPDLIIDNVKLDPEEPIADPNHSATLTFIVRNQGNGSTTKNITSVVYPDSSSFFYVQPADYQGCSLTTSLSPGNECAMTFHVSFIEKSYGSQKMIIEIGGGATQEESNIDNNKYVHNFAIATVKNIPNYKLTVSPDKIKRGETYSFKVEISNAKPSLKIFFNLRRPDKSIKYDNYDTGQYTDANGFWSGTINQYVTIEGKNGEWESFVIIGGITSNALYHNVISSQLLNTPYVAVSFPNGGEVFAIDSVQKIKWQSSNVNNIELHLTNKYGAVMAAHLKNVIGNPGEIVDWKIPNIPVGDYKLKIVGCTEENYNCVEDLSDSTFSIVVSDYFSVSELSEGDVVKSPSDPTVYVIKDSKKQPIASPQEFEQLGYKWDQIKTVQADLLKQIADLKAQISQLREELKKAGTLIKNPNGPEVYVITPDGKKKHITSPEEFKQKGYKWDQIQIVTSDEISQIPDFTPGQKEEGAYPNGTLIKSADSPDVYVIVNGQKRKIPDPATFNNWGYKWEQIKEAPAADVNKFSNIEISSDIVRAKGDNKIYRIIGDKKIWIPTVQAFLGSGYKPNSEIEIEQADLTNFDDVKYIKAKGGTYVYEIKGNKKYRVTNTANIPTQDIKTVTVAEFTAYPIGQ